MLFAYVLIGSCFAIYDNQYLSGRWEYEGKHQDTFRQIQEYAKENNWVFSLCFFVNTLIWPLALISFLLGEE